MNRNKNRATHTFWIIVVYTLLLSTIVLAQSGYAQDGCSNSNPEAVAIFANYTLICNDNDEAEILTIQNKSLSSIPTEIGKLTTLRVLEIRSNNNLTRIPDQIGKLVNLQILQIERNANLDYIPSTVGNLINVTELNIFDNSSLSLIPPEITYMTKMKELSILNNADDVVVPLSLAESEFPNMTDYFVRPEPFADIAPVAPTAITTSKMTTASTTSLIYLSLFGLLGSATVIRLRNRQ